LFHQLDTRYNIFQYVSIGENTCNIFQYEKNTVKLTLVKQEELSWEVKLSKNGLDQDPNVE